MPNISPARAVAALILAVAVWASAPLAAQQVSPYRVPFEAEQIDLLRSANGIAYRLTVRKPLREARPGERGIAVYVLDAQWNLPAAATMHANSEVLAHFPPIYFVGVGYQDEADGKGSERHRTRDYTPTAFRPSNPGTHFLTPAGYEASGGAPAFLDVLARDVIPYVESRYPVDTATRAIVGKSLGGLLATTALLTRPSLFSHYLIISPALWWDDYFVDFRDRAIARLEQSSSSTRLTRPTQVWIGMGSGEERLGMLADVYVLGRALRLRNDPSLTLTIRQLEGEVHESVFAPAFAVGMRALFPRTAPARP